MNEDFHGVIKLDVRDSTPDWTPYELKRAPEGAPNVLIVLYDDTGLAAWSPFGGRINMPTLEKLADNGLMYSQWHTTALCSPTRSCFLTGRNHHVNRCACDHGRLERLSRGGGRLPAECATIGQVLQDNGYSTFWVGKNHDVPEEDVASGGSRSEWPLQKGFDRFYGFLGGETNNWYPDLVEDNSSSSSRTARSRATTCRRIWPIRRCGCCAISRPRIRRSPGTCGSVRAPTTRRITPRGSSPTSTRACSTTATRPTASGCWPA